MTRRIALTTAVLLALAGGARAQVLRPDGTADFTRYHDAAEAAAFLRQIETRYPDLARVSSIGKSFKGQDLWVVELTNRKIGTPAEKPGYYIDGGVHAGELAGSRTAGSMKTRPTTSTATAPSPRCGSGARTGPSGSRRTIPGS